MTQEQINLLITDICSRVPYGVKCSFGVDDAIYIIEGINPNCCGASEIQATHIKSGINGDFKINSCKPYLYPLLSMTEEQKKDYDKIIYHSIGEYSDIVEIDLFDELQEFYHKNHFDYKGLIPMGLANDATGLNIY